MAHFSTRTSLIALILLLILVSSGVLSIAVSLMLGFGYSLIIGNPFQLRTQWASALILKASIVIMGFGLNISEILYTAQESFNITLLSIIFALLVGILLGKVFNVDSRLSFLIVGGTTICGGSAIAALAPAINAKPGHILISISIVFLLNAIGLIIYPLLGEELSLSQTAFGLWAALGIHDTSSVVGAAAIYGEEALKVATTTKLARALWIIPLVFIAGFIFRKERQSAKPPYFIILFVIASLLSTFLSILTPLASWAPIIAKKGMAISLFLIGAGFSKETLSEIRYNALSQGVVLWVLVSIFSLWLINSL